MYRTLAIGRLSENLRDICPSREYHSRRELTVIAIFLEIFLELAESLIDILAVYLSGSSIHTIRTISK